MADIFILDTIGFFGASLDDIKDQLVDLPESEEVTVHIDSAGGDVPAGFAIYNFLKGLPNQVTTRIEGQAASIASIIALAGDTVEISETADMMIHNAWTQAVGDHEDLRKTADNLEDVTDRLVNVYQNKTGLSEERIKELMTEETILSAADALSMGFVDAIVNKVNAMAMAKNRLNQTYYVMNNFEKFMSRMGFRAEQKPDDPPKPAEEEKPAEAPQEEPKPAEETPQADPEALTLESLKAELKAEQELRIKTQAKLAELEAIPEQIEQLSQALFNFVGAEGDNVVSVVRKEINSALAGITSNHQTPVAQEAGNIPQGGYQPRFTTLKQRQQEAGKRAYARARNQK